MRPGTHDPPASASAAKTDAAAPPTRAATPKSPAPSTDASAPSATRARTGYEPSDTQTTTANDPPPPRRHERADRTQAAPRQVSEPYAVASARSSSPTLMPLPVGSAR